MNTPKVEIIVPIFNEAKNIDRCMTNLLLQTYENCDILLVNDGSNDGSGEICDSYANKYENVRVVHRKNGGLSAARNTGVKNTVADYVTFVDSDDYVSIYLIEVLMRSIQENDADMSIVHMKMVSTIADDVLNEHCKEKQVYVFDTENALKTMCYRKMFGCSACAKLIRKELAIKYPFPEGRLYEDLATTYKMIGDCNKVVYTDVTSYFYVQHNGAGITRGGGVRDSLMQFMLLTA